ncbi:C6 transcription factor RegA [Podospora australis]|uniref:C6 transcription factor RegA n=1 Tax=Podospora australis TaxID=1536484 RepID=A0AAN6WQY0_9PEZI|nr:C6 transcription factor RegA [Podospora australis]
MASPITYLINPPDAPRPRSPPPPPPPIQKPAVGTPLLSANHTNSTPHLNTHPSNAFHGPAPVSVPVASSSTPVTALPHHQQQRDSEPRTPTGNQPSGGLHNKAESLYQCAHCLRRYSRPEHLQRHIATHTLGKRFTCDACDICSKAFARADLLKRHRTSHDNDNGTKRRRINSSPSASRVAHACQACAKARVKCEEMKPCTRCKTRGIACEVASSEDAAMHLLHLSAQAHNQEGAPIDRLGPSMPLKDVGSQHHQHHPSALNSQSTTFSPLVVQNGPHRLDHTSLTTIDGRQVKEEEEEEAQLPTPETVMDQNQSNTGGFRPVYPSQDVEQDMEKLPFSDFLRDVLYDQTVDHPARMAEAQGLAVLDFCDDSNLDFREFDFGVLDNWGLEASQGVLDTATSSDNPVEMAAMGSTLVKIWTDSPWRWYPQNTDNTYIEQGNLPLSSNDTQLQNTKIKTNRVVKDILQTSNRDKILAIVLGTCRDNAMVTRIASSFPSADAMDKWIHIFLAAHMCQVSSWIHYGTFNLNQQSPEWLAMAVAAGAALAPVSTLRKFGFALQEAIRVSIPNRFEEKNINIGIIGQVQALVLVQDVGLWSGSRRKMEIAECHLTVPIAMMRYRGKFSRIAYPDIVIHQSDEGKVLEEKWKKWYELESWKRLVFHAFLRDGQVSMTQFNNPSMSYAELTLPLPCSKDLWFARTAEEFKIRYLESGTREGKRPPCLGDLFRDINALSINHNLLDVQYSISIYLHSFWSLIWEYRQMKSVHRPSTHPPSFVADNMDVLLNARRSELCKQLETFQHVTRGWHEMLSAQENMVLHLLFMNLNVSLNDLQLFSGKEGEDQARRIYPNLQRWCTSPEARQALWHAGQILRQGKLFPAGHLKDFYAIAVHHAALCLWAYGIITRASSSRQNTMMAAMGIETVFIDGEDSASVQQWLHYGQGRPAIRGPSKGAGITHRQQYQGSSSSGGGPSQNLLLEDPRGCMVAVQEILQANFAGGRESLPPVSENIVVVLKQLESAAWAIGFG